MNFNELLGIMVKENASDLYLTTGSPPCLRLEGELVQMNMPKCKVGITRVIAEQIMDEEQKAAFEYKPELNLALSLPEIGRFRVNIFKQRSELGLVVRHIRTEIPDWESLGLPEIMTRLVMQKRGLILVVGATGTGKSTTMASLINYRNRASSDHIISVEDPIEFLHKHRRSMINQREIGLDSNCYEDALENVLRQAPDVIMIGEIRNREVMEHAISFAETGHLTISTLHANNANQALDRIINFFPEDRRQQLLMDLSLNLRGIISQRLIPSLEGKRVAAFELLLQTPTVSDLILQGNISGIKKVMDKSDGLGMQTFDKALYDLYADGKISEENALENADSKNNLRLKIEFEQKTNKKEDQKLPLSGFWEDK